MILKRHSATKKYQLFISINNSKIENTTNIEVNNAPIKIEVHVGQYVSL